MTQTSSALAIHGGVPAIPPGLILKWPPIDQTDRDLVLASLQGQNHAFGPNCQAFQQEFATWNGNKHAVFTNSGTAALHMAVVACGVGAGDHVLVTAYSWSSSATCILHHNAIPQFVDINFDTVNIDVDKIEAAITPKTKAIIVVHLHGLAVNMDNILRIARKHGLKVIEDACQSHGALFHGKKVGTFGDCAAFSFNQNKCLCTGEGGMFVTNNEELLQRATQLWNFGESRTPVQSRDYHAYALGWMYRGNDLTAAFGRAQLQKLDGYLATQRANAAVMIETLKDTPGLVLPFEPPGHQHTYYNFTCRIDAKALGFDGDPAPLRDRILNALKAEGVPAGIWQSFPLPAMTVFQAKNAYGKNSPWAEHDAMDADYNPSHYPIAQKHCQEHFGMTVPLRAPNTPDIARQVALAIRKVFHHVDQLASAQPAMAARS